MNTHACTRWAFDLSNWTPSLPQLAQAVAAVQLEERFRLQKFHFIDDFLASLVGRLLMRRYVSDRSGLSYHNVRFTRDVRGKPFWERPLEKRLDHVPNLSFNVSHHGDLVVLAGVCANENNDTNDFGVGIDVMKIEYSSGKPLSDFFRLMQKKFSDNEWRYMMRPQHNEAEQLKAFMRHWCLKEAYVKELGVGITIDLQKLSFSVDPDEDLELATEPLTSATLCCNGQTLHNWCFEEHLLQPQYCAAIAFNNCRPVSGKFDYVKIDALLEKNEFAEEEHILAYCRSALQKPRKA